MNILNKSKQFLELGKTAVLFSITPLLIVSMVGDIAPKGIELEKPFASFTENIKNGIDTIAYNSMSIALTQSTESYRQNVMENLMKGRCSAFGFYILTNDIEKKINKDNLLKAEKLGIFKDKEAFEAEIELLRAAAKKDKPNDRILVQDNGIIDITDPSHFNGVKSLEQVKKKIGETLAGLKNTDSSNDENKPNI